MSEDNISKDDQKNNLRTYRDHKKAQATQKSTENSSDAEQPFLSAFDRKQQAIDRAKQTLKLNADSIKETQPSSINTFKTRPIEAVNEDVENNDFEEISHPQPSKPSFEPMKPGYNFGNPPPPPIQPSISLDNGPNTYFGLNQQEFERLIEFRTNYEARNRFKMFMLGVLFLPVTLAGALVGYVRGFNRFNKSKGYLPNLFPLLRTDRAAIAIGIIAAWLVTLIIGVIFILVPAFIGTGMNAYRWGKLFGFYTFNTVVSLIVFAVWTVWEAQLKHQAAEARKFGSARFANDNELEPLRKREGYYIGKDLFYNDSGHLITTAGTRGGKGTNIIIPNLLGAGNIETSWVVIDPKGENAAITGRYQRESGQNLVILNPWNLLNDNIGPARTYNPLDMFAGADDPHLVDDVQMLAEMIVPIDKSVKDPFWTDTARMIIAGLLLHLVTSQPKQDRNLRTLWNWVRLYGLEWDKLVQDMGISIVPVNGPIVRNASKEILKLTEAGEDTFGSIISSVLQATDFLKSPSLQKSLESDFDPKILADGKTTVYVIIPADKLKSHGRWLRLVVTSMMRSVIRKPKNRVTFLLDEFAALGYLPEVETALSTYAGYNVTVWPILQSLVQLKANYGENWQSFIANCNVRQYFSINDNESADYISAAIGKTSNVLSAKNWLGRKDAESTERLLITPDELRRESGKNIFMFVGDLPPTYFGKLPYYDVPELYVRGMDNPYISVLLKVS